jgi:hypothetical protein
VFARRHGWQNIATMRLVTTVQFARPTLLMPRSRGSNAYFTQGSPDFIGLLSMAVKGCHLRTMARG